MTGSRGKEDATEFGREGYLKILETKRCVCVSVCVRVVCVRYMGPCQYVRVCVCVRGYVCVEIWVHVCTCVDTDVRG